MLLQHILLPLPPHADSQLYHPVLLLSRGDGALGSVGLSMDLSGYDAKAGRVTICVNGKVLGPERLSGSGGNLTCTDPPFRRGENRLSLLLEKSPAEVKSPVTVEEIQLKVDYK